MGISNKVARVIKKVNILITTVLSPKILKSLLAKSHDPPSSRVVGLGPRA